MGDGSGSTVVVENVLLRLEERPNQCVCLQSAGHDESELTRCGAQLIVRNVSGRSIAWFVGRAS